jgi:SAM-dependent methyltransferase
MKGGDVKDAPNCGEDCSPSEVQRNHYNLIGTKYHLHYGDSWSIKYRDTFINSVMLKDVPLQGNAVLDAMCGGGETTQYLLQAGARVSAIDISEAVVAINQREWPQCDVKCASILNTGFPDNHFDVVVIVGGLHHSHPHCLEAIQEMHRILKPGGFFCFAEPHLGSILDSLRVFWYRHDKLFMPNEAALDVNDLKRSFSSEFEFVGETYGGNLAYFLVLNSMVFRIPLYLKRLYSPVLFWAESLVNKFQGRKWSCFVACTWRKK